MTLRDEWFGKDGISDLIRSKLGILTVTQMAEVVQPTEYPFNEEPDQVLKDLIEMEFKRYQNLTGVDLRLYSRLTEVLLEWGGNFPETQSVIDSYHEKLSLDPISAADDLARLAFLFEQSQSQSRKTRAGSSLELQLEYILRNNGITKWEKQKKLTMPDGRTTKVDFIFPSVEHFENDPLDCIAFCCQTTSNDRFRSALGQVKLGMKFIPTGIGSSNFGSNLQKLTLPKLEEVQNSGAKYVMFPEGKNFNEVMSAHSAIITYSELIQRIKERHDAWPSY